MSLLNIKTDEIKLALSLLIILISFIIVFINLQSQVIINSKKIDLIESKIQIQTEMYFNLKNLFELHGWKWVSCDN
jgi:hypothetical protein